MPREMVGSADDGPFRAKVGWSPWPTGSVQVAVEVHRDGDPGLWPVLFGVDEDYHETGTLARLGAEVRDRMHLVTHEDDPVKIGRLVLEALNASAHYHGVTTHLDRGDVNTMIRLLRRARDAAFGRDE